MQAESNNSIKYKNSLNKWINNWIFISKYKPRRPFILVLLDSACIGLVPDGQEKFKTNREILLSYKLPKNEI